MAFGIIKYRFSVLLVYMLWTLNSVFVDTVKASDATFAVYSDKPVIVPAMSPSTMAMHISINILGARGGTSSLVGSSIWTRKRWVTSPRYQLGTQPGWVSLALPITKRLLYFWWVRYYLGHFTEDCSVYSFSFHDMQLHRYCASFFLLLFNGFS